ncbi:MAG: DUF262 and DUF1524 domain-containing protein [Proteobacteria bacterium]|nr:DUF262 and DUF1524 domain-containing protein [Pseudomonadota bacterium]MBU1716126.1 DUF262 and DUF1524 domain-containing protein [Pseudomonadota bacterium]
MKATETKLLDYLRKSAQFIIPIYQRTYSWTQKQCDQLWRDIVRAGLDDSVTGHFVGSVVYVEKGLYSHSSIPQLLVIDGQQRLTTISLFIAALAGAIEGHGGIDTTSPKKLRNYFLLNSEEEGELAYKLLLTQTDKDTLIKIVEDKKIPAKYSRRVAENFQFFVDKLKESSVDLKTIYDGLCKLIIVDISLSRDHDNPQLIFESLNSTGLELSQADLIRNYVLMGLEAKEQEGLYNDYWFPMEQNFAKANYVQLFDRFMRDYLTLKTGSIPNIREVYDAFKVYANKKDTGTIGEIVSDIHRHSIYFVAMVLDKEVDKELKEAFNDINTLKVDVAYPLLLELYDDYDSGRLAKDEFVSALRLVESYVFRRAVCGIPTNSMNKTFANLSKEIKKDKYLESLQAAFITKTTYMRIPNDDEFMRELVVKDLYNFRSKNYWLRKLENHGRKERVDVESFTIEHILPQNLDLSSEWRSDLGPEWQEIQNHYLHTIGNLTLTGYNSELSDRPFKEKRDMDGGFSDSPIRLNRGLNKLDIWNKGTIEKRAKELASLSTQVWGYPVLDEDVIKSYLPKERKRGGAVYTRADHHHLTGSTGELFDQFRKHVLNLDSSVTEEYLKLYVAYKTTTNFVDVVPQASGLRLSLNMKFDEIDDPDGFCKNVTDKGRWGNGDVEIKISEIDQISYVMKFIRQSFEKHMDNGDI